LNMYVRDGHYGAPNPLKKVERGCLSRGRLIFEVANNPLHLFKSPF
jgi:hypothetical protein